MGFVENHDMIRRRSSIDESLVAEVMHVLNEGANRVARFSLAQILSARLGARNFITRQRLAQDLNERTVS